MKKNGVCHNRFLSQRPQSNAPSASSNALNWHLVPANTHESPPQGNLCTTTTNSRASLTAPHFPESVEKECDRKGGRGERSASQSNMKRTLLQGGGRIYMQMKRAGGGRLGRARRESLSSRSLPEMRRVMGLRFPKSCVLLGSKYKPGLLYFHRSRSLFFS